MKISLVLGVVLGVVVINTSISPVAAQFSNTGRGIGVEAPLENINTPGAQDGTAPNLLTIVEQGINIFLGLLTFITLLLILYAGWLITTAAGDNSKFQQGFSIIKWCVIGIFVIGLSFLISRFVFQVLNTGTEVVEMQ